MVEGTEELPSSSISSRSESDCTGNIAARSSGVKPDASAPPVSCSSSSVGRGGRLRGTFLSCGSSLFDGGGVLDLEVSVVLDLGVSLIEGGGVLDIDEDVCPDERSGTSGSMMNSCSVAPGGPGGPGGP